MSVIAEILLVVGVIFSVFWYMTSSDSVYETVEGDIVSTKMVFLILSVVCFVSCLIIEFIEYY